MWVQTTLYYQEKDNGNVELLGGYRAEYGQAEYLADQMLDIFGLESGVTPVGCTAPFSLL